MSVSSEDQRLIERISTIGGENYHQGGFERKQVSTDEWS